MTTTLFNCRSETGARFNLTIAGSAITGREPAAESASAPETALAIEDVTGDLSDHKLIDCHDELIIPALIDGHIHSRDPGFTAKEDWQSLAASAFKGGVVAVADMPNTMPPMMTEPEIIAKAEIASASGLDFGLYLGVGKGNIDQIGPLLDRSDLPLCGAKIYYGQSTGELMYDDLERLGQSLPKTDRLLSFHSEDQCYIDKAFLEENGTELNFSSHDQFRLHSKIRSASAAMSSTRKILAWGKDLGRSIHIAHLSTPEEAEAIVEARAKGVKVTTEVAPHHLIFAIPDYDRLGPWIKMNPPVRTAEQRDRLRAMFAAGHIDAFATDHAPHLKSEKQQTRYRDCPSGVPAIEFFAPLLLTLADELNMPLAQAIEVGAAKPASLFGFPKLGRLEPGYQASLVHIKKQPWAITADTIAAKCGWSPYEGMTMAYQVAATFKDGQLKFRS